MSAAAVLPAPGDAAVEVGFAGAAGAELVSVTRAGDLRRQRVQENLQDLVLSWIHDRPRRDRTDLEKFDGTTLMAKVSKRHAFFSTFHAPRHRLAPLDPSWWWNVTVLSTVWRGRLALP